MGWQSRDYAKLSDAELDELYGVRRDRPAPGRSVAWTLVAMLVTAVLSFAYHERGAVYGGPVNGSTPPVLYGSLVTSGPLAGNVCTEAEFVAATHAWRCDTYAVNTAHVPVYPATAYRGACAHMRVEGRAWICLSAVPEPSGSA